MVDGRLIEIMDAPKSRVASVSRDGRFVVSGNNNGEVIAVPLAEAGKMFEFRREDRVISHLAFSAEGDRVVVLAPRTDGQHSVHVIDAENGSYLYSLLGGKGPVRYVSVHPLSGELAVSGEECKVWDLGGSDWRFANGSHSCVAFWGDDGWVFAPTERSNAGLAKLRLGGFDSKGVKYSQGHRGVSVSQDPPLAVVGNLLTLAPIHLVRRVEDGMEELGRFVPEHHLTGFWLSPGGGKLALSTRGGRILSLVDPRSGERLVELEQEFLNAAHDFVWLDQGTLVGAVTAFRQRGTKGSVEGLARWDAASGRVVKKVDSIETINVLCASPDGRRLAEAGGGRNVRIREGGSLDITHEFRVHDGPVTALAWHPTEAVVATGSEDLRVRLWSVRTGELLKEFRGPCAAPHTLRFSPDGKRLGCASLDRVTRIWDLEKFGGSRSVLGD